MKHFKVRLENLMGEWHAIEGWFDAPNIVAAVEEVMVRFGVLGLDENCVVQLIEVASSRVSLTKRSGPEGRATARLTVECEALAGKATTTVARQRDRR
jgi:hypothetical protein